MPIQDTQQPQPGPSPTPTPKPVVALKIISISTQSNGTAILTLHAPVGELLVSKEFMQECQPDAGGYYVRYDNLKSYLSASDYEDRFPQT